MLGRKVIPFLMVLGAAVWTHTNPVDAQTEIIDIPPEEWRELALGRTLTYRIDGNFFAIERYSRTGNFVEHQLANGECLAGTWNHQGNAYCFNWDSGNPACFRHTRHGGRIIIIQLENGVDTELTQEMTAIGDAPLSCSQNLS